MNTGYTDGSDELEFYEKAKAVPCRDVLRVEPPKEHFREGLHLALEKTVCNGKQRPQDIPPQDFVQGDYVHRVNRKVARNFVRQVDELNVSMFKFFGVICSTLFKTPKHFF